MKIKKYNKRYTKNMIIVDKLLQKSLNIGPNQVTNLIIDFVVGENGVSCRNCREFRPEFELGYCFECFKYKIKIWEWKENILERCLGNLRMGLSKYIQISRVCNCCPFGVLFYEKYILKQGCSKNIGICTYFINYKEKVTITRQELTLEEMFFMDSIE